jgi:nucleotide-binding universal stress UspA family protein
MKKSKKILFPTDFSAPASNAFRYALILADKLEANIEILHVVFPEAEPLDFPVLVAQSTQMRLESAREQLTQFVDIGLTQMVQLLRNVPAISSNIELGTPSKIISDIALRNDIDLIVIGTKGAHSNLEKFMGSVAAGVVKKSPCSVLVVPEDAAFKLDKIAYASNLNEADPFEIWKMIRLLDMESPTIRCIHFNPGDEEMGAEIMEEMEDFFMEKSPNIKVHFQNLPGSNIIKNLNDFIDLYEIDLLAMYQPHRSFFENLFHNSSTKEMAIKTHVPLLVMKSS